MSLRTRVDALQKKITQVGTREDSLIFCNFKRKEDLTELKGPGGPYFRLEDETYKDFRLRAIEGARAAVPFGCFPILISGGNDVI